jgi:predicted dehydrogenase
MTRHRTKLRVKPEQTEFARWTLRHGSRKNGSASWTFHLASSLLPPARIAFTWSPLLIETYIADIGEIAPAVPPTFEDRLQKQLVLDAITKSAKARRWLKL